MRNSIPLPEKNTRTVNWLSSDEQFNQLYPPSIRLLSSRHWTPLSVARKASCFLAAEPHSKILDIGSGVGKFFLSAAYYQPKSFFYGIEQRKSLHNDAETAKAILRISNVSLIQGNFTQINFKKYDHFYFYNSFYENLTGTDKIDNQIDYSSELFHYYHRYLYKQLEQKPAGTRLASFHSLEDDLPAGFHIVGSEMDNLLKFWIKI